MQDENCKSDNLYRGITACTADQHVHVEGSTDFVSKLICLAEPELSGLRQERHAKTIEIAKKEVLTCIGICLYDRFQRIQQRLREGQQSCDILFLVALKSLKKSYDVAFESKQGFSDLERLCQEFDEEDRRKQEKAQKKRNNKKSKQQLKKRKDNEKSEPADDKPDGAGEESKPSPKNKPLPIDPKARSRSTSSSESSSSTSAQKYDDDKTEEGCDDDDKPRDANGTCDEKIVTPRVDCVVKNATRVCGNDVPAATSLSASTSRLSCVTSVCRKTTKVPAADSFSILSLERMLEGSEEQDEEVGPEDEGIPIEEIRSFQARQSAVIQQREELRKNLRQRFAQLCVNGL